MFTWRVLKINRNLHYTDVIVFISVSEYRVTTSYFCQKRRPLLDRDVPTDRTPKKSKKLPSIVTSLFCTFGFTKCEAGGRTQEFSRVRARFFQEQNFFWSIRTNVKKKKQNSRKKVQKSQSSRLRGRASCPTCPPPCVRPWVIGSEHLFLHSYKILLLYSFFGVPGEI